MKIKFYLYSFLIFQLIALYLYASLHFGQTPRLFEEYEKSGYHFGQEDLINELKNEGIKIPEKLEVNYDRDKQIFVGLSTKTLLLLSIPYYIAIAFHLLSFLFFYLYLKLKISNYRSAPPNVK